MKKKEKKTIKWIFFLGGLEHSNGLSRRTEHRFYAEIVMDSTTRNSERKDTHVSFHKANISETFDKNPSSVDSGF